MGSFRYQAIDASGSVVRGLVEAASQTAVAQRLAESGHVLLEAEPLAPGSIRGFLAQPVGGTRVPGRELQLLTRSLSTLLGAGVPLEQAVRFAALGGRSKVLRGAMDRVLARVRDGAGFADALGGEPDIFKADYVGVIRAAEHSGDLALGLEELAGFLERRGELSASLRSALIYPSILLLMIVFTLVLVVTVVLPEFRPIFEDVGAALPLPTRIVMGVGTFVETYWWLIVGAGLGGPFACILALRDPGRRLRFDRALLSVPMVSELIRKIETARFARTLGALLRGGVDLPQALGLVAQAVRNKAFEAAVGDVQMRIREGGDLASPVAAAGIFPDLAVQLVRIGEEAGRLPAMLGEIATLFERDAKTVIDRLMAALTPALTIGMGMLIAAIIGSVLIGILSINQLAV